MIDRLGHQLLKRPGCTSTNFFAPRLNQRLVCSERDSLVACQAIRGGDGRKRYENRSNEASGLNTQIETGRRQKYFDRWSSSSFTTYRAWSGWMNIVLSFCRSTHSGRRRATVVGRHKPPGQIAIKTYRVKDV